MTPSHNPHAGRTSTVKPPAQGQGTVGSTKPHSTECWSRHGSVRNSGARDVCEVATWDTADSAGAGGMPGNGTPMAKHVHHDTPDQRIWSAYLIGIQHGIQAMTTAIPVDPQYMNLPTLLREIRNQERRDDE